MKKIFKCFIIIALVTAIIAGVWWFIGKKVNKKDEVVNIAKIDFTEEQKLNMIRYMNDFESSSDLSVDEMMGAISYGVHRGYIDGGSIEEGYMVIPEEKIKSAVYSLFGVELKENKSSENEYEYKYENGKYYFGLADGDPMPFVINMKREESNGETKYRYNYVEIGSFLEYEGNRYEVIMKDGFVQSKKLVGDSIFFEAENIKHNSLDSVDQESLRVIEKFIKNGEQQLKTTEEDDYYIYQDDFGGKYEIKSITEIMIGEKLMSQDEKHTLYEVTLYYKNKDGNSFDSENSAYNFDIGIVIDNETNEYEIHGPYEKYKATQQLNFDYSFDM